MVYLERFLQGFNWDLHNQIILWSCPELSNRNREQSVTHLPSHHVCCFSTPGLRQLLLFEKCWYSWMPLSVFFWSLHSLLVLSWSVSVGGEPQPPGTPYPEFSCGLLISLCTFSLPVSLQSGVCWGLLTLPPPLPWIKPLSQKNLLQLLFLLFPSPRARSCAQGLDPQQASPSPPPLFFFFKLLAGDK